jgi:8-oxo-dGTP pyrophosphatase MutT (NUDIX family)
LKSGKTDEEFGMVHPPVVVVDTNDQVVGEAMLQEARDKGLIYRVVFVIARNPDGQVLLQRRSPQMPIYPNCWDVSASGHVDGRRSYLQAAQLELLEEIGVQHVRLQEVGHLYTEEPLWGGIASKRFAKLYQVALDELPERLGEEEVTQVRWFTPDEVRTLVATHPEQMAEGLQRSLPYILGTA